MRLLFVESPGFTDQIRRRFLDDEAFGELQQRLIQNPRAGATMPGCGGFRKLRISDPSRQKGTRGGARVIYLHVEQVNRLYLIDIYSKDEKDDLSPDEKKELRRLAEALRREAIAARRGRGDGG